MNYRFPLWYQLHSLYSSQHSDFRRKPRPKTNDFKDLTLYDMVASAVKRQPGYKNVLEVYISNENTFTRVTMKRSEFLFGSYLLKFEILNSFQGPNDRRK